MPGHGHGPGLPRFACPSSIRRCQSVAGMAMDRVIRVVGECMLEALQPADTRATAPPSRGRGGLPSLNMWDLAGVWHGIGFRFQLPLPMTRTRCVGSGQTAPSRRTAIVNRLLPPPSLQSPPPTCTPRLAHRWSGRFAAARKVANQEQQQPTQPGMGIFAHPSIHPSPQNSHTTRPPYAFRTLGWQGKNNLLR